MPDALSMWLPTRLPMVVWCGRRNSSQAWAVRPASSGVSCSLHTGGRRSKAAIPPLLTWDLNAALAQLTAQPRQPGGSADAPAEAGISVTGVVQPQGSPDSPVATAAYDSSAAEDDGMPTAGGAPSEAAAGAAASLPRRPSLGSVLRAVSLPCQPCGDDDPTMSPRSEPAEAARVAQACRPVTSSIPVSA